MTSRCFDRHLVCVHSLTAHGVVGLKAFFSVLGEHCLPVPSVVLSGPGNMPGVQRQSTEVGRLLDATLAHVAFEHRTVDLLIGYLAKASQVVEILAALGRHRTVIDHLTIDPVCGDDGRAYVAQDLIAAWPRLIAHADLLLPNITEARLLAGNRSGDPLPALRALAPRADIVITGIANGNDVETRFQTRDTLHPQSHHQARIGGSTIGTGDRFAAACWQAYRVSGYTLADAVGAAAQDVAAQLAARPPVVDPVR